MLLYLASQGVFPLWWEAYLSYLISSDLRESLFERMKKLGTQSPMKIPKRSPYASSRLEAVNQVATEAAMERNPRMRHASESARRFFLL